MKFTHEEIKKFTESKKNIQTLSSLRGMLSMLEQASVSSDSLTRDNNWNLFLQLLQAWVDKTEQQKSVLQLQLSAPEVVNADEMHRIKNYILQCDERLHTLEAVIKLPKQIMDAGEEARLELTRIGEELLDEEDKDT